MVGHGDGLDQQVGKNPKLLTRIECVVDALFDRRDQRLLLAVETKLGNVPVEILADVGLAMLARHAFSVRTTCIRFLLGHPWQSSFPRLCGSVRAVSIHPKQET